VNEGLLLDTHVWVWIANGLLHPDPGLIKRLEAAASRDAIFLSSISLYEVANAARRGRMNLLRSLEDWFAANLRRPGVRIIDVTSSIALETTRLPAAFHGDPGDRLIAATARLEGLALVTHDKELLRFGKKGLFPVLKASQKRNTP
jgi:PIN domain nuclease of toxin-antitoxin system